MDWIKQSASFPLIFVLTIAVPIINHLYCFIIHRLQGYDLFDVFGEFSFPELKIDDKNLSFVLLFSAFAEEVFCRLPLVIISLFGFSDWGAILMVLMCSVEFGLLHGSFRNIIFQGFGGLILSVLFLKSGGYQGLIILPLVATTTAHLLQNAITVRINLFYNKISS